MDIAQIAVAGIYAATDRFQQAAQDTARDGADYAQAAVEMVQAKASVAALAQVARTGEAMTSRLLDIRV
jgi:hypothetical protein